MTKYTLPACGHYLSVTNLATQIGIFNTQNQEFVLHTYYNTMELLVEESLELIIHGESNVYIVTPFTLQPEHIVEVNCDACGIKHDVLIGDKEWCLYGITTYGLPQLTDL